ncbi:hypothetical protein AA0Y32_06585 [Georgenia phoenicis]|uniref:hypothetical protein n=1 Tax=unclassified Georgenia TaxID=2626815 RepID=UPI0039B08477
MAELGVPAGAAANVLGARPTTTQITHVRGLFRQRVSVEERTVSDWTIDGVSLRQVIAQRSGWPDEADLPAEHPPLRSDGFWPELAVKSLRSLLGDGPTELPDARVVLLSCAGCANISCGALTAELVIGDDAVEWRDIGWQDDDRFDVEHDGLAPPLSLRFSWTPYSALLRRLLSEYAALVPTPR